MTKSRARKFADLLDASGDIKSDALGNTTSDLVDDASPQLGGDLDTNGNDINFGDNDKAQFGAGNDLQIYHNGSNSIVQDGGTGNLQFVANNIDVLSSTFENVAKFNENSDVKLYYDNAAKLSTTSTGVDVTGTVQADGLTVDGTSRFNNYIDFGGTISTPNTAAAIYRPADNTLAFSTANTERMRIDSSGNVGIGTTSPNSNLQVNDTTGSISSTKEVTSEFRRSDGTYNPRLQIRHSTTGSDIHHTWSSSAGQLTLSTGGVVRLRIDGGNLTATSEGSNNLRVDLRQGSAKGWSHLDNSGGFSLRESYNISSSADRGVGQYEVYWNNDFNNSYYSWAGSMYTTNSAVAAVAASSAGSGNVWSASSISMAVEDVDAGYRDSDVNTVISHGDLA